MKTCSEEGCGRAVVARGLCDKHYQRMRRGSTRDRPGPAPKYSEGQRAKDGGAPTLGVRLDPDLLSWVRQQGGSSWVRHVLAQLRAMSVEAGFARHWKRLQKPVEPPQPPQE